MAIIGDPIWDVAIFLNSLTQAINSSSINFEGNPSFLTDIQQILKSFCDVYFNGIPICSYIPKLTIYWRLQNIDLYEKLHYEARITDLLNGIITAAN